MFLPPRDAPNQRVYFVEVQFQKDPYFYHRFFAEIFLFLNQNKSTADWHAVVIYPKQNLESDETRLFRFLLAIPQVQRVYLDRLEPVPQDSLGLGIVKLIVDKQDRVVSIATELISLARQEQ